MKPVVIKGLTFEWSGDLPVRPDDDGGRVTYWEMSPKDLLRAVRGRIVVIETFPDGSMKAGVSPLLADCDVLR